SSRRLQRTHQAAMVGPSTSRVTYSESSAIQDQPPPASGLPFGDASAASWSDSAMPSASDPTVADVTSTTVRPMATVRTDGRSTSPPLQSLITVLLRIMPLRSESRRGGQIGLERRDAYGRTLPRGQQGRRHRDHDLE